MRREEDRIVTGTHEIYKIPDPLVRVASYYVFTILHPGEEVKIGYETLEFWHDLGDRKEGHIPDMNVILSYKDYIRETTKSKAKNYYCYPESHPIWLGKTDVIKNEMGSVEIIPFIKKSDPKRKQKRVMQHVAPDADYEVWDGDFFETLFDRYPKLKDLPY